jgi:hypothetical protein
VGAEPRSHGHPRLETRNRISKISLGRL